MRAGIPSQATRERTITLYLDKPSFKADLEMPDKEHIYVMLVNRQGQVLFCLRGPLSPEGGKLVTQKVKQLCG